KERLCRVLIHSISPCPFTGCLWRLCIIRLTHEGGDRGLLVDDDPSRKPDGMRRARWFGFRHLTGRSAPRRRRGTSEVDPGARTALGLDGLDEHSGGDQVTTRFARALALRELDGPPLLLQGLEDLLFDEMGSEIAEGDQFVHPVRVELREPQES